MRKIAILALLLLTAAATFAAPVLPEKAQQSASKFLRQHRPGVTLKSSPPSTPKMRGSGQQTPSYYIFNTEGNKGYVIVSGDDRTIPILGYIDKGSFDANHVPSNMQAWLDSYSDQIASLDALGITQSYESSFTMKPTRNSISPLITSHWDQGDPYWGRCPEFMDIDENGDTIGEYAYTGCVAT
jgi:hypothetical protein